MQILKVTRAILLARSASKTSSSAFGAINTQLVCVSNENGVLVFEVQAISTTTYSNTKSYQHSVSMSGQLATYYQSHSFTHEKFADATTTANKSGNALQFKYVCGPSGGPKIGGSFTTIVRITIHYDQNSGTGSIVWGGGFNFSVKITDDDEEHAGTALGPPSCLTDFSLPVWMTDLSATHSPRSGIMLSWRTESEINCEGFHIWRSKEEEGSYA